MEESTTAGPKVKYKTFTYRTQLKWLENRSGTLSGEQKPSLRVASPPEFKGEAGVWTPEELFVGCVDICTMTTFLAFAEHLQIPLVSYTSMAEGVLEFVDGSYKFTKVILRPTILVSSSEAVEQARRTLHDAHKRCLITNSICAEVIAEPSIAVEK
jgi:organic hydroperoxide reductase OsmC/OhrA